MTSKHPPESSSAKVARRVQMDVDFTATDVNKRRSAKDTSTLTTSTAPCSSNEDIPAVPMELKSVVQAVEVLCSQTHRSRLADFSSTELDFLLKPVVAALENLDAASLLSYKSREGSKGRRFSDYKPMHKFVQPALRPGLENQVRYLHVHEEPEKYNIGIFVFPPGSRIPLHDHPGMCVLSRVLHGSLNVQSFDVIPEQKNWLKKRFGNKKSNTLKSVKLPKKKLSAPAVTSLYPAKNNIHEFKCGMDVGSNGAVVLDVLLPPYNFDERDCNFYEPQDHGRILKFVEQPPDFHCISGVYGRLGSMD
uniref:Cysteine dioxygenase n=1 Tax=Leptocylindrus danicus TaxID=163516 RepID=A0A7S2K321_9STRA